MQMEQEVDRPTTWRKPTRPRLLLSWPLRAKLALAGWLVRHARRQAHKRALARALAIWEVTHPSWSGCLIDLHFLEGRGAEALGTRDPSSLARAWTTQFTYRDELRRARDIRKVVPAFEGLLEQLEAEEARVEHEIASLLRASLGDRDSL